MRNIPRAFSILLCGAVFSELQADEIQFPQIIRTLCEAKDQATGGIHLWMEREKVSYGLDPRLFPDARTIDIAQVPTAGSTTLTYVEVTTVATTIPEYIYLSGNARFHFNGRILKSSNFPAGGGMNGQ